MQKQAKTNTCAVRLGYSIGCSDTHGHTDVGYGHGYIAPGILKRDQSVCCGLDVSFLTSWGTSWGNELLVVRHLLMYVRTDMDRVFRQTYIEYTALLSWMGHQRHTWVSAIRGGNWAIGSRGSGSGLVMGGVEWWTIKVEASDCGFVVLARCGSCGAVAWRGPVALSVFLLLC